MAEDFYTLLGIPYDATPEEIRSAYFNLARTMHPDANPDPEVKDDFLVVQPGEQVAMTYDENVIGCTPAEAAS